MFLSDKFITYTGIIGNGILILLPALAAFSAANIQFKLFLLFIMLSTLWSWFIIGWFTIKVLKTDGVPKRAIAVWTISLIVLFYTFRIFDSILDLSFFGL